MHSTARIQDVRQMEDRRIITRIMRRITTEDQSVTIVILQDLRQRLFVQDQLESALCVLLAKEQLIIRMISVIFVQIRHRAKKDQPEMSVREMLLQSVEKVRETIIVVMKDQLEILTEITTETAIEIMSA